MRWLLVGAALAALCCGPALAQFTPTMGTPGSGSVVGGGSYPPPPVVSVFKATFAATGAPITDESGAVAHETLTTGSLVESKSVTWTQQGTPVFSAVPLYPNGFSASAGTSPTFSDANYWSSTSAALSTASGVFTFCALLKPTQTSRETVPFAVGDGTHGWVLDLTNISSQAGVLVRGNSELLGQVYTATYINTLCVGLDGAGKLWSAANGATASTSTGITYTAPVSNNAFLGRLTNASGLSFDGQILQTYLTTTAPTQALMDTIQARLHDQTTDSGHLLTITRSTTASDTVKGGSVTFAPYALRISELGGYFSASTEIPTVDPTGLVNWQQQRGYVTLTPDWASNAASSDRYFYKMNGWSLRYVAASSVFRLVVGGVTVSSAAQSFLASTTHTVSFRWRIGSANSVCLTVDSQAEACAAEAPIPISWAPPERMYLCGDGTTACGAHAKFELDRVGATDLGELPLASMAFDANSIDNANNTTVSDNSFVSAWKQIAASPGCFHCADGLNATQAEQPKAHKGLGTRGSWVVTYDGVWDKLTVNSHSDMGGIGSGTFEMIARIRRASTSNCQPGIRSCTVNGRSIFDSAQGISNAAGTWRWDIDANGAQEFIVNTGSGVPAVQTSYTGSASPGAWAWYGVKGDGTQVCVSSDLVNYTCTAKGVPAWPGLAADGTISLDAIPIDGDLGLLVGNGVAAFSSADRARIKTYGEARWSGSPTRDAVVLGDSITMGYLEACTDIPFPARVTTLLGSGWQVGNAGVSGQLTDEIAARYASQIQGHGARVVVVWGGAVNSIKWPVSQSTIIAQLTALYDAIRADGSKLVVATVLPWKNWGTWTSPLQTVTDNVNTAIRAYAAAHPSDTVLVDAYARYGDDVGQPFGEGGGDARALGTVCDAWSGHDGLHPGDPCVADEAQQVATAITAAAALP